jgi:hypothetical protein
VTTFAAVPDAPISRFTLHIDGGRHGILVVTGDRTNICAKKQVAQALIDGQNGKTADQSVGIRTTSCAKHRAKKHRRHARRSVGHFRVTSLRSGAPLRLGG